MAVKSAMNKKIHICVSSSGTGIEEEQHKNLKVKKIFYSLLNENKMRRIVADVAVWGFWHYSYEFYYKQDGLWINEYRNGKFV